MSTLIDREGKSEDTMAEKQLNYELNDGRFKERIGSASSTRSRLLSSSKIPQARTVRETDVQEGNERMSSSPRLPVPQDHISVLENVPRYFSMDLSGMVEEAVVFTSPEYEIREESSPSRQSEVTSEEEDIENEIHEESHTNENVVLGSFTSQVFQRPVYEEREARRNSNTRIPSLAQQQSRPLRLSGLDWPALERASEGLRSAAPPTGASRINAPPQPTPRLRRLSLPDANVAAAAARHHVHEHHHHVWNHLVPGAGGSPPWPPQRGPWQPWSQQLRSHRCPMCGRGRWPPMWLLVQFPWGQVCKMAAFGGVLVFVAMRLYRGARLLAPALLPPSVE